MVALHESSWFQRVDWPLAQEIEKGNSDSLQVMYVVMIVMLMRLLRAEVQTMICFRLVLVMI